MKKVLLLSVLFMVILTGCFDKKTRTDRENNSDYLEIMNFISENNIGEVGNIILRDGSSSGSSNIINSSALIPIDKIVAINFTESINAQTVNDLTAYINDPKGVPLPAQLTVVDNQINIIPNEFLLPSERYTIVITRGVKDIRGRSLEGIFIYTFPTEPDVIIAPTLLSLTPANGTVAPISTNVVMTFSESITGNGVILLKDNATNAVVDGTTSISGSRLRFVPQNDLIDGASYTVSLQGTVEDSEGDVYVGITTWSFSTVPLIADTTPPTLTSLTPAANAIDVNVSTDITMVFDETIADNGVILELSDSFGNIVSGGSVSGDTLNFNPVSDLAAGETYIVTLIGTVQDLSGNNYIGTTSWSFTTLATPPISDTTPPTLTSLRPIDGEIDVDKAMNMTMVFDENITGTGILSLRDNNSSSDVVGSSSLNGDTLSFNATNDLIAGHAYTVTLENSIKDIAGNIYVGQTSWNFTVAPLLDTTAPTLILLAPDDGESVNSAFVVTITFDENIINEGETLSVTNNITHLTVPGTSTSNGNKLWFVPLSPLVDANYRATIVGETFDHSGNLYIGQSTWSFTVAPPQDTTPPVLTSLTPTENETDVDKAINMTMVFDENIANNGASLEVRDSLNVLVNGTDAIAANTLNFNPSSDLTESETYTVTVAGAIEDLAGNVYTGTSSWSFTVAPLLDTTPPNVDTFTPADGTIEAKSDTEISVKFDENITSTGAGLKVTDNTLGMPVVGSTSVTGNTLWFIPDSDLSEDHNYTVNIQGAIKDLSGNVYTGQTSWSFVVEAFKVSRVSRFGDLVRVSFSNYLDSATVSESDFEIDFGAITFHSFNYTNFLKLVTFRSDTPLTGSEIISVSGTIKDTMGNSVNNGIPTDYPL